MCRVATADFEATGLASSTARHWVGGLPAAWDLPGLVDTAELLTSELVTNAVVHAASQPTLAVAVGDGVLDIGVTDRDSCQPQPPQRPRAGAITPDAMSITEGGRGLLLVDALARE